MATPIHPSLMPKPLGGAIGRRCPRAPNREGIAGASDPSPPSHREADGSARLGHRSPSGVPRAACILPRPAPEGVRLWPIRASRRTRLVFLDVADPIGFCTHAGSPRMLAGGLPPRHEVFDGFGRVPQLGRRYAGVDEAFEPNEDLPFGRRHAHDTWSLLLGGIGESCALTSSKNTCCLEWWPGQSLASSPVPSLAWSGVTPSAKRRQEERRPESSKQDN